tara:strand:+ start:1441 stop:1563 length:123 start_codon:yes stop_codon:yes gene_type:complete
MSDQEQGGGKEGQRPKKEPHMIKESGDKKKTKNKSSDKKK